MSKPLRFFLGPIEICGYYGALTRGLREAGAVAHFFNAAEGEDIYQYDTRQGPHWIIDLYLTGLRRFRATRALSRFSPGRYLATAFCVFAQLLLICWVAFFHDVVVLKSGMGVLNSGMDLKLYRLLRRTIIFIYHGSESRPPYINGGYVGRSEEWLSERTKTVKQNLDRVEKYATYVADNPLSCHLHGRKIVIVQVLGNSIDQSKLMPVEESQGCRGEAVSILHAPSVAAVKGTDKVRQAIRSLKENDYNINYVELTNVPNHVVMKAIAQSDIVVDELYSDTFAGMLSLEAMMHGRPAIVGGYGFDVLDKVVPGEFAAPTVRITPEALLPALERLVCDRQLRQSIGEKSKQFALRHGSPRQVAERLIAVACGRAPEKWFFSPEYATYLYGIGGSREAIRGMVAKLIAHAGPEALQLNDKPAVLARFVAFAEGKPG